MTGKRMRDLFFTEDQDDSHKCFYRCGTKRRVTGTGYINLVNHLREKHPDEYSAVLEGAFPIELT